MLVEAFRAAQKARSGVGHVIAADVDRFAPALAMADVKLVAPRTEEAGFASWIEAVCARHAPLLILTLFEPDLFFLEPIRSKLHQLGAILVGMPEQSLEICRDKQRIAEMCAEIGISSPETWAGDCSGSIPAERYPLLMKERSGRGSRGQRIIRNPNELAELTNLEFADFCLQEMVTGPEFGLDIINDLEGRFVTVFAREKISMREGETAVARTADPAMFSVVARALSAKLAHQGCMDVDVIVSGNDVVLLDINPRFGGGYPFSHLAGADLPAALLCWTAGEKPDARWFQPQVGMLAAKAPMVVRLHEA